jgi:hypothetical protein
MVFAALSGDLATEFSAYIQIAVPYLFNIVLSIAIIAVGIFLNNSRFYYFSGVALVLTFAGYFLGYPKGIALAVLSGVMILTGLFLLANFLRQFSISIEEDSDEE